MSSEGLDQLRAARNDITVAESAYETVALDCECGNVHCSDAVVITITEHRQARDLKAKIVSLRHARLVEGVVVTITDRFALTVREAL